MKYTFRKKPVLVHALKWNGTNSDEILAFTNNEVSIKDNTIIINTLEGEETVSINDWIIKGIKGEFYPCKPNVFVETYSKVE